MPGNESRSAQKQKRGKTAALVTPESEILIDLADWCVSAPTPRALCVCVCEMITCTLEYTSFGINPPEGDSPGVDYETVESLRGPFTVRVADAAAY